ncbi:acyl carrier protein [Ralstonia phage RP13]|nr:acyl carrier protein [Ralstonia phage RP13]
MTNTTQARVIQVITQTICVMEDVKLEHKLVDDLGADSIEIIEVGMDIEDEFHMEIPDEDIEKWVTVQDVVTYIENRVGK